MKDKSYGFLTEEARKLHEEYRRCQNMKEIQTLIERENKLNESVENNVIPHIDMTLEEFRAKYHTISHEDLMKKYGF